MKTLCLCLVLVLCSVEGAFAQAGDIGLYSDTPGYSDHCLAEVVGVNSVWVVHDYAASAHSAKFRVVYDWAATAQPTDYHGNAVVGDVYTGVEVTYPVNESGWPCQPLPYLIAELRFLVTSPSGPCGGTANVVPHPDAASGQIEWTDCGGSTLYASGGWLRVNGDVVNCPCMWDPIAAEPGTWGRVKALYR